MTLPRYTSEDVSRFIQYGDVVEGIPFDWWLCGSAGAGFCLVPTVGVHTDDQIKQAKTKLRRNRDVVGRIEIFWNEP